MQISCNERQKSTVNGEIKRERTILTAKIRGEIPPSFLLISDFKLFFLLMQQGVCTLSKFPLAKPVLNTFSCRNVTVQQAN